MVTSHDNSFPPRSNNLRSSSDGLFAGAGRWRERDHRLSGMHSATKTCYSRLCEVARGLHQDGRRDRPLGTGELPHHARAGR
jgi:hypothetical protein